MRLKAKKPLINNVIVFSCMLFNMIFILFLYTTVNFRQHIRANITP